MASIDDLTEAQSQYDYWLGIQRNGGVKSAGANDRSVTYDTETIKHWLTYWRDEVRRLSRGSGVSVQQVTIRD